jgi:Tfp pilus assembly ATPase PilU
MYSMSHLLELAHTEHAEQLSICVGAPPVFVIEDRRHEVEGHALTAEEAEQLLRGIANTRQMRELRARGTVQFMYTFRGATSFLVCARLQHELIGFEIR